MYAHARAAGQGYNEAQHLYVKAAADIFFDTPSYNAHSSGCDVLWSGTPLLTGSSACHAVLWSRCRITLRAGF